MAIFAIVAQPNPNTSRLPAAIEAAYAGNVIPVAEGVWLVAGSSTSQEVTDKIGLAQGGNGAALVLAISGYFGYASQNIWEWMKAKWETGPNG